MSLNRIPAGETRADKFKTHLPPADTVMVTRRKQPTLDSHHAADDNNVSFLSPLHIWEDFLHQPHQAKEVGVHHRLHFFHCLTLDGSN